MNKMFKVLLTSMIATPMFASPDVGAKSRSGFFIEASVFGQRAKGSFKKNSDLLDKYKRFHSYLKSNEAIQKKIAEDVKTIQNTQNNLDTKNKAEALIQDAYKTTTDIEFNGDEFKNIDDPTYNIDQFKESMIKQKRQYKSIGPGMFVVRKDKMIRVDTDGFAKKLDDPTADGDRLIQAGVVTENDGALNNPTNNDPNAKFVAYRMTERPEDVFDYGSNETADTINKIDLEAIDPNDPKKLDNFCYGTDENSDESDDFYRLNAESAWKTHSLSPEKVVGNDTLRASIAIGLDDKSLEAAGLPTLKALNFLNLSGHGVVQDVWYITEDTKDVIKDGKFFLMNARTFGINVDSNIKAAIDESLNDFDKFKSDLISDAKKKGLTAEEGNSDLAYSDAKKFSFGSDVTLGCRQSIGDFDLYGGLTASFVFAKKTLEIKDSDSTSNDSSSSNEANSSDESKDNETSTNLKYQIDVKMKPSFGFTLGLAYRIFQNFSAGVGVDITNARYEINTNDISKLFIAENDYVANKLSELGASTYDFNKDVIEKGLGNNKLSVSKWGVSPYVKLAYHLNDCASVFLKFGYDRRHILQNSNTSIGDLKLTGMKVGLGISLNI